MHTDEYVICPICKKEHQIPLQKECGCGNPIELLDLYEIQKHYIVPQVMYLNTWKPNLVK